MKELKLQLEIKERKKSSSHKHHNGSRSFQKHPAFDESKDNIDAYINRFEIYAESQGWSKQDDWAVHVSALLQGKTLFEYANMPAPDALN